MRFMPLSLSAPLALAGLLFVAPIHGMAAEWLAPAADERISANWVKEVAKALKKDRYKNVFMNQPFGCDQCRILGYLNNAAEALDNDQPKLAKSFVRRALAVMNAGQEDGWYDPRDTQAVKHLIMRKASQGFREAGAPQMAMTTPREQGRDPRYERGDEPLFGGPEFSERHPDTIDRWSGYTEGNRYGLTERLDRSRQGRSNDREAQRERSARNRPPDQGRSEPRGDDVALEERARRGSPDRSSRQGPSYEQGADERSSREQSLHRRGRDRFPDRMTAEDALNALMDDEEEAS